MFILIGPHVRHFSDGNQTVCPTLKNKSWPPIIPKQRLRCLLYVPLMFRFFLKLIDFMDFSLFEQFLNII
jgi:hypothetical protein